MKTWFKILNLAESKGPVEVMIYDQIGKDYFDNSGVGAKDFAEQFNAIPKNKEILLRIHSPGGSVWDGLAIYNIIRARRDNVTAQVDGVAFSAASFIAMAAKKVVMPATARMMIHDASGFAIGNSKDMRDLADLLDQESDNIANIYAEKTGKTATEIRALMKATTWMNGTEAKDLGFADEVTDTAATENKFDLSMFRDVPEGIQNSARGGQPQKTKVMNRKQIEALLNKHGIKFENSATDEQLIALLDTIHNQPAPANVVGFEAIKAQLDLERKKRITNEVAAIPGIPVNDREGWVSKIMADESLMELAKKIPAPQSPDNVQGLGMIENLGNPGLEAYRKMKPGAERRDFSVENFAALTAAMRKSGPQNANTLAAALVPDFLANALVVIAQNKLAMLTAFSRDFGTDPLRPGVTVQVAKATAGATAQQNATNWESGDSTLAAIGVTINQESVSFHITNAQANQGHKLAELAEINAEVLANTISDRVTALMVAANYGAATVIGAAAAFTSTGLPAIYALAKNYRKKNLILDGGHLAYLLPTNKWQFALGEQGAFGFDLIAENNRWTSGVANIAGFICGPDAIATASGFPADATAPTGEFLSIGNTTLKNGLSIQTRSWFSRASRTQWASYDVMFGAAAGDTTQAENLVTA